MKVQVEVGERSIAFVDALGMFLRKAAGALEDGFQPGQDLPAIALAAFTELAPVLGTYAQVKEEFEANPDSVIFIGAFLGNEIKSLF